LLVAARAIANYRPYQAPAINRSGFKAKIYPGGKQYPITQIKKAYNGQLFLFIVLNSFFPHPLQRQFFIFYCKNLTQT